MMPTTFKRLALRFLPDRVLQKLKKVHYAKALRASSTNGEPDLNVVRHLVGPGGHVIDIGANFGLYTKFLAEMVQPHGRVYSIEPIPLTYEILTSNVKQLQLRNVEPFNIAVSDDDAEVRMEIPQFTSGGENFYEARIINRPAGHNLRTVAVQARAIDSLFGQVKSIDFVKCDVEGHELACLRGAADLLRVHQPAWLIEISGSPDSAGSNAAEVFGIMRGHGYMPFWYDGRHLRQREAGDRSVNYFFLTRRHLRLIPEDLMRQWNIARAA